MPLGNTNGGNASSTRRQNTRTSISHRRGLQRSHGGTRGGRRDHCLVFQKRPDPAVADRPSTLPCPCRGIHPPADPHGSRRSPVPFVRETVPHHPSPSTCARV